MKKDTPLYKRFGDAEGKQRIAELMGITDLSPYAAVSTSQMLAALRENAGYSLEDVGLKMGLSAASAKARASAMEKDPHEGNIHDLCNALKPRLHELKEQCLLSAGSLAIDGEMRQKIGCAFKTLREHKNIPAFEAAKGIGIVNDTLRKFENNPNTLNQKTFLTLLESALHYYKQASVADLLKEADAIREQENQERIERERKEIERQQSERLEKERLEKERQERKRLEKERTQRERQALRKEKPADERRIPGEIFKAWRELRDLTYQQAYVDTGLLRSIVAGRKLENLGSMSADVTPGFLDILKCESLEQFERDGLRLVELCDDPQKRKRMALAIYFITNNPNAHITQRKLASGAEGLTSRVVNQFINKLEGNLSQIDRMAKSVGVTSIFHLEQMGKRIEYLLKAVGNEKVFSRYSQASNYIAKSFLKEALARYQGDPEKLSHAERIVKQFAENRNKSPQMNKTI